MIRNKLCCAYLKLKIFSASQLISGSATGEPGQMLFGNSSASSMSFATIASADSPARFGSKPSKILHNTSSGLV